MNPVMQGLMNQLKARNAGGFQMVSSLMQNGGNPEAIIKQLIGKVSPEQKQYVLNQAKGYGCPDSILSKLQNMK